MRLFLANTNSYWLDEIYSVMIFGIENKTGAEALERISHDVQPPLHQIILYYWMVLFGDGEVVTRTLSNLYVTGATLCLYILTLELYGPRVAIATALIFSLMYIPIYYALETRCYAQVLFLVSLSSLLLYYFLCRLPERPNWGALLRDGRLYALVLVNFALALTHYYTVFFLGAQGIFLLAYLLVRGRGRDLVSTAAKGALIASMPLVLVLISWGPVMAGSTGTLSQNLLTWSLDCRRILLDLLRHGRHAELHLSSPGSRRDRHDVRASAPPSSAGGEIDPSR